MLFSALYLEVLFLEVCFLELRFLEMLSERGVHALLAEQNKKRPPG